MCPNFLSLQQWHLNLIPIFVTMHRNKGNKNHRKWRVATGVICLIVWKNQRTFSAWGQKQKHVCSNLLPRCRLWTCQIRPFLMPRNTYLSSFYYGGHLLLMLLFCTTKFTIQEKGQKIFKYLIFFY